MRVVGNSRSPAHLSKIAWSPSTARAPVKFIAHTSTHQSNTTQLTYGATTGIMANGVIQEAQLSPRDRAMRRVN